MMEAWFDAKENGDYPVVGGVEDAGTLLAFGSYGPFRTWPAYKYSVEQTPSVGHHRAHTPPAVPQPQHRCRERGKHALHRRFGFEFSGNIRHAGFEFGRWLDPHFYQLPLDTPAYPVDG
ncbi:MAG: GNAT family N-acetyltransferase [Sulfurifustaceae bacterium]